MATGVRLLALFLVAAAARAGPGPCIGRRQALLALPAVAGLRPQPARAREWMSGKGDKPRKSGDVAGTRKDPSFLRCLNNCLPDCLGGPSGEQRDKRDCLVDCQDQCCATYEQCTYAIVKD